MHDIKRLAIVAGGPDKNIPNISHYNKEIDYWIGCDRGALTILKHQLPLNLAIGDFDSVTEREREQIRSYATRTDMYPVEKDYSDLELAIKAAYALNIEEIILFGVTGGRLDHELLVIFILEKYLIEGVKISVIDRQNEITVYLPGRYRLEQDDRYPKLSFLPMSEVVHKLHLEGFYYPLTNVDVKRGDSLTLSNHLIGQYGYFSFDNGILILIKSSEQLND
ncbi:thiamine diphosphokinase [Amphibacillus jilinensis]|uniref:thiamine diphosphokinase n=1 Tax=Amphibacillus jilinensis TaxID=1216008 RepID=UPI0002D55BD8|nr:thiamine diphosphokinase [Amphibacillus jilinensis]